MNDSPYSKNRTLDWVVFTITGYVGSKKLHAIKFVRTLSKALMREDLGLKMAKALVDRLDNGGQITVAFPASVRPLVEALFADNTHCVVYDAPDTLSDYHITNLRKMRDKAREESDYTTEDSIAYALNKLDAQNKYQGWEDIHWVDPCERNPY